MRKIKSAIAVMSLLAAVFVACNNGTEQKTESVSTEQNQIAEMYQCPMKCEGEKTYDKPGKCPVCGMDLVKLEKNSGEKKDTTSSK